MQITEQIAFQYFIKNATPLYSKALISTGIRADQYTG
jgi:hypothetical protein